LELKKNAPKLDLRWALLEEGSAIAMAEQPVGQSTTQLPDDASSPVRLLLGTGQSLAARKQADERNWKIGKVKEIKRPRLFDNDSC
jgi:hypothetical protein